LAGRTRCPAPVNGHHKALARLFRLELIESTVDVAGHGLVDIALALVLEVELDVVHVPVRRLALQESKREVLAQRRSGVPVSTGVRCGSKVLDTPAHLYITMNMGGTPQTGESIYVAGTMYTKFGDKWSVSPVSLQEMKAMAQKNRQTNKTTCRYLKNEAVNGEVAAVYSMHDEGPKGKSDSQIWISKAKGLPLRSEVDLGDKNHVSTRYEYGNVKPPM
jgi:hypothetical protein